jgi:hypothetical protein
MVVCVCECVYIYEKVIKVSMNVTKVSMKVIKVRGVFQS